MRARSLAPHVALFSVRRILERSPRMIAAIAAMERAATSRATVAQVEQLIARGQLLAIEEPHRRVVIEITPESQPIGPESTPENWIELRLLDEDGEAVADEPYVVELPDGRVRRGTTNASGKAREDGIDPGTCKITFPRLDRTLVKKVA